MRDARTVKLAYRPVTAEALERFLRLRSLELGGKAPGEALREVGLAADEASRIGAAVNSYCRPRLLKRRLARAEPRSAERQRKQQEKLAEPIDDADFLTLYGKETWDVMRAREDAVVALREKAESLITRG